MRVLFFEILLIFRKEYGAPWQLMKLYWGWHLYNFYFFIYLFIFFWHLRVDLIKRNMLQLKLFE